ncbi:hypothetical protein JX266_005033 [Neoarthrinium moseri]|nr:hypothetical protein JX266_005033 [Neoarthrinium moseri]
MFGWALLLWVNPLLRLGYSKNLEIGDLFPLEGDLDGSHLTDRLAKKWRTTNRSKKHCLTSSVLITFAPEILACWLPRAFNIGFMMAQPYLIQTMLFYIINHNIIPVSHGYGLIGAYAAVFIGTAITNQIYMFLNYRAIVKLRGALVGIIYRDMLKTRAESKHASSALTLMSTDVDKICLSARSVIDIFPNIVQVGLAMWILGIQLGPVCVAPVIVAIVCAAGVGGLARMIPSRQRRWIVAIQKRVGITSDILGSMKGIKMSGMSSPVTTKIQDLRDFELSESRKFRKIQIWMISANIVPMLSMSAVTFTVYAIVAKVSGSGTLGISQAFTSLNLITLLAMPVSSFNSVAQCLSCLDRIQDFLLLKKWTDYRVNSETSSRITTNNNSEKYAIIIEEANFGWDENNEKANLKGINVKVPIGGLSLVVGPVASGKSTLLKSIIGETYIHSGTVSILGSAAVAYCDQDAWVLNQTIRANIVAFSEYSEGFYKTVVNACQLEEDFSHLPNGDLSMVGSQGISLSGGQKARVALARAIYSRKKIVVLDDTMKGLDADTSSRCFKALLGKSGLLRQNGTTVVMATHNGKTGTFTSLRDQDEYIRDLQESYKSSDRDKDESEDIQSSTIAISVLANPSEKKDNSEKGHLQSKELMGTADDKKVKTRGGMNSSLPYYVKSLMSNSFLIFCSLIIFQVACRVLQPLWLNYWTAANASNPNEDPGKWVGIYVLLSVMNLAGMIVQFSIFLLRIVPRSAKSLHWGILRIAMSAPMSYFVTTDVGEIVNRFSQDMTLVDFPLPVALMQFSEQLIMAVGQIIMTCVSSGYLAASIPVLALVLFYIQRFYLRTSRQLRLLDLEFKSPLYSFFISSFAGLTTIRAYGWSEKCYQEHLSRLNTSQRPFNLLYCVQRWLTLVLELTVAGLCVLLVGISVGIRDKVAPGLLGVALTSVSSFGQTMTMVIIFWTELETSLGAITRIREFIADTPQEKEGSNTLPPEWPPQGHISISGLSAKYGERTVLDGIDLEIKAGERVALCGRSGSGKSTLLALLLRLYDPASGTIEIDGIDTSTMRVNDVRESVVTLPQDPLLLAGTVRYNLDLASCASDEDMLAALEKTGLRDLIKGKGGLDAELRTEWLSAGQKQLFCLARAMLRQSRILLLDEATSSLDQQTDELMQSLIRKEFVGWTMVVVAHRLKTIADFDNVLVLQDGNVVEFDSPETLLEGGGLFKTLWDLQES